MGLVSALLVTCVCSGGSAPDEVRVQTDTGVVIGARRSGVHEFRGTPFAAHGRWMPPQRPAAWDTPFDARSRRVECLGSLLCRDGKNHSGLTCTEDCLAADITAPDIVQNGGLPVMVFFPGGAFIEGCTACDGGMYDSSTLSRNHGVVVVALNYRLSAFGFLALVDTTISGNFGIMDQRAGLEWVHRNIAAFGGDPEKVTIFGESAGAMSVGIHMASNKTAGLFRGAIMESNVVGWKYRTIEEASKTVGQRFLRELPQCKSKAGAELEECLRSLDASALKNVSDKMPGSFVDGQDLIENILPWTPVVDGSELEDQVLNVFEAGRQQLVPMIIGSNTNELAFFTQFYPQFVNWLFQDAALDYIFGAGAGSYLERQYPHSNFHDGTTRFVRFATDWLFQCSSDRLATTHRAAGGEAYVYRFNHSYAVHGEELWYVFGWGHDSLSRVIGEYWTSFAKELQPVSPTSRSLWPPYNASSNTCAVLDADAAGGANVTFEARWPVCTVWDSVGYYHSATTPFQIAEYV